MGYISEKINEYEDAIINKMEKKGSGDKKRSAIIASIVIILLAVAAVVLNIFVF